MMLGLVAKSHIARIRIGSCVLFSLIICPSIFLIEYIFVCFPAWDEPKTERDCVTRVPGPFARSAAPFVLPLGLGGCNFEGFYLLSPQLP